MAMAMVPSSSSFSTLSSPTHNGLRLCKSFSLFRIPPRTAPPQKSSSQPSFSFCVKASAVTLPVMTFEGGSSGSEAELDIRIARAETARAVVHRGLITDLQNKRRGTASTLTRGEVRGGGIKPYKQKKTGRARRGSQRTPLRPGGGVIFGPKPRDWTIKINRKEKQLAISTAIQSAAASTNMVVIEDLDNRIATPKTKDLLSAMKKWGVDPAKPTLIFTTNASENLVLSSRNVSTLKVLTPRTLNLYDILRVEKLVVTKSAIEYLNQQYAASPQQEFVEA